MYIFIFIHKGNLLVKENFEIQKAINIYNKILTLNPTLFNVWFNKAYAEIKIQQYNNAITSLQKTLELNPTVSAARHMLTALVEKDALVTTFSDEKYISDLFNTYASSYDAHGKKLIYAAPRVLRQELAKIYREKFNYQQQQLKQQQQQQLEVKLDFLDTKSNTENLNINNIIEISNNDDVEKINKFKKNLNLFSNPVYDLYKESSTSTSSSNSTCQTYTSFMNNSLDILDLGF
jgi:tetratricopeptide (TPR) repeat protein